MPAFNTSIATRLVATVLATGVTAFGMIGGLAMLRLDLGLREQANALGRLSERQLSVRLDGEAQLARARIESIGQEAAMRLRQIAQRADVAKAVASHNDITIRELLATVAKTSEMQRLIAFDSDGTPIGVSDVLDLLAINSEFKTSDLAVDLQSVLKNNSRAAPRGHQSIHVLSVGLLGALKLPLQQSVASEVFEPVFDDFGELIGALGGFRLIGQTERTLENFTSLSNAGVVILHGNEVVSAAGPDASFSKTDLISNGLIYSDDGTHVARCTNHGSALKVCTFTDASAVTESRDQMFRIGAAETRSLMRQFLVVAAIALLVLVIALLIGVRYATYGLSTLASVARAVADGDIERPFKALGVGEVFSLGLAFEQMLENLRASMGRIKHLAFFDGVTGLPNREKFRLDATQIIESRQSGSLWFIDLDGFKSINDTFGHKTGDLLLRKVSERLKIIFADVAATIAHPDDVRLARVAGDEFVAVIPDLADMDKISRTAKSLLESLCIPFEINGAHVNIGASVGITIFPADALTYEDLLINADLAMYAAKERGRNTFALYSAEIAEGARTRLALEQELKNAVRVGQLSVHYQLTVSCYDGSIRGVEALARWHHPTLGTVSPGCFVKIAEETGLVREIDRFILKRAIEEIKSLGEVAQGIVLAVNISAACVEDPFLVGEIEKLLNASKFDPSRLELEITESVAMRDPDTVLKSINELQRLGIRLAIDDFGAGYSNLATLARLPFDTVKLDRSLISGFSSDREKQTIVRIAQAMASELGFETVVEGIEKMQELELVAKFGATYAQGFLFSRPVPIDQLAPLLRPARLSGIAKKALSNDATDRNLTARPTAYVVNG